MSFGQNYLKSIRINEKEKTESRPYKLTIIPTVIDWIQRALVGDCDLEEVKTLGAPVECLNALGELNKAKLFESGSSLRLKVTPTGSMCIEEQRLSKDSSIMNMKLKDNMKLDWHVASRSNIATAYIRTILQLLPHVLVNYHRTCLQGLKEKEISRVSDMENDSKRFLELCYALDMPLNWNQSNDIDYLVFRSGMNLDSVIAVVTFAKVIRQDVSQRLDDKIGVPHKCLRSGLFKTPSSPSLSLGSEQLPIKNNRDVTIRLMHRVWEQRDTSRVVVNHNNYLDDDESDEVQLPIPPTTVQRLDSKINSWNAPINKEIIEDAFYSKTSNLTINNPHSGAPSSSNSNLIAEDSD